MEVMCVEDAKYRYYSNGMIYLKEYHRWVGLTNSNGYLIVRINGKMKGVHRVIYEKFKGPIPEKMDIDHINHDKTNNNIDNLDVKCRRDNTSRRRITKTNTSGFIGVYFDKNANKYRASIMINGKRKHLGLFDKSIDAAIFRDQFVLDNKFIHYSLNFPSCFNK